MKKIPVIIDCDPGHDDMMALVLAYGSGRLDIRAVTTVAGNNTIENTTQNALHLLEYIGAGDIPVAMGYQNPMVRNHQEEMRKMAEARKKIHPDAVQKTETKEIVGAGVHCKSGMDGFTFPDLCTKKAEPLHSVEMRRAL